jgi:hypothetical protein
MAIHLDSASQIPQDIADELRLFDRVLAECQFVEQLLENRRLRQLAAELDELCLKQGVVGYHYTRAVAEQIAGHGLRPSSGVDRRRVFISLYGHLFTRAQRERIHRLWGDYFDVQQTRARDGRIWFNFTLGALEDGGADRLLTFFGGESIYVAQRPKSTS